MSEEASDASTAVTPADAFAVLGDDTRLEILRALGEHPDGPTAFSDLFDRVDVADSGQFNYHLEKLLGRFVGKTDDGYELTTAGKQIYGAVLSGMYTDTAELGPVELDDHCPECGAALELAYEDEIVRMTCTECDTSVVHFPMPPAAIEAREIDELVSVLDSYLRTTLDQVAAGFCNLCSGRTRGELILPDEDDEEPGDADDGETGDADADDGQFDVVFECEQCGRTLRTVAPALVLSHPAVVAFYHDHGLDVRDERLWRMDVLGENDATVRSRNPPRVSVAVERDGDTLEAVVDEDLTVEVVAD